MTDHDHPREVAAFGLCRTCTARDRTATTDARDAALERAESAAPDQWLDEARLVVQTLAASMPEFTSDSVWERLAQPPEPRALGAVMRRLAEEGVIASTGRVRPSMRPECHSRPCMIWRPVRYAQVGEKPVEPRLFDTSA